MLHLGALGGNHHHAAKAAHLLLMLGAQIDEAGRIGAAQNARRFRRRDFTHGMSEHALGMEPRRIRMAVSADWIA